MLITVFKIADGKPIMYEKTFLQDVANQDFKKYTVESRFATAAPVNYQGYYLELLTFGRKIESLY